MQIQDFDDNTISQPLPGKAPLFLTTAASVLIHALTLGILVITAVNPFARQADRQEPPVIQVTLSSLVANNVSQVDRIPPAPSNRGLNSKISRKPSEVVIASKQDAPPPLKKDEISPVPPVAVSAGQLPSWAEEATERVDSTSGKPAPVILSGSDHFSVTDESLSLVKPRYVLTPYPVYPAAARTQGQEGMVLLSVEILANGRSGQVLIKKSSGYNLLDQSALNAVRTWRFEPAKRKQTPQAMMVDIPIRFSLKNDR